MKAWRDLQRAGAGLRRVGPRLHGLLGDFDGNTIDAATGEWLVRVEQPDGSYQVGLFGGKPRDAYNMPVIIERNAATGVQEIVDVDTEQLARGNPGYAGATVEKHASAHEIGGDDALWMLDLRQISNLRIEPTGVASEIRVNGGIFWADGLQLLRTSLTVDLSSYTPGAGAVWYGVYLDSSAAVVLDGPHAGPADIPLKLDHQLVGGVRLRASSTTIRMPDDILDARFAMLPSWSSLGGGEIQIFDTYIAVGTDFPNFTGDWVRLGNLGADGWGGCVPEAQSPVGMQIMRDGQHGYMMLETEDGGTEYNLVLMLSGTAANKITLRRCESPAVDLLVFDLTNAGYLQPGATLYVDQLAERTLGADVTVAGVAIGAHAANADAHHAAFVQADADALYLKLDGSTLGATAQAQEFAQGIMVDRIEPTVYADWGVTFPSGHTEFEERVWLLDGLAFRQVGIPDYTGHYEQINRVDDDLCIYSHWLRELEEPHSLVSVGDIVLYGLDDTAVLTIKGQDKLVRLNQLAGTGTRLLAVDADGDVGAATYLEDAAYLKADGSVIGATGQAQQFYDVEIIGSANRLVLTDTNYIAFYNGGALPVAALQTYHLPAAGDPELYAMGFWEFDSDPAIRLTALAGTGTRLLAVDADGDVGESGVVKSGAGVLTLTAGSAYTVTVNGSCTLNDWFDQPVKVAATPTFASVIVPNAGYIGNGAATARIVFESSGYISMRSASMVLENAKPILWLNTGGSGDAPLYLDSSNYLHIEAGLGGIIQFFNNNAANEIARLIGSSRNLLLGTTTDGMTAGGSLAIAKDVDHRGTRAGFGAATLRTSTVVSKLNVEPDAAATYNLGAEAYGWASIYGTGVRFTPDGGLAVKLAAGEALTRGEVVYSKQTSGADGKVWKCPTSGDGRDMPIGIVYNTAAADAAVWVVTNGFAYVLPESTITATRGYVIYSSGTTAGRVEQSASAPVSDHWREVGHFVDTGSGAGAITRAVIHFN